MFYVIRSNTVFFRAHRGATILLVATLSLIFFVTLMQHALCFQSLREIEKYRSEYFSMYRIRYASADQSSTTSLIEATNDLAAPIRYINVYGEVVLADPKATGDSISESKDDEDLVISTSLPHLSIFGIDSTCTLPIDILQGSSPREYGGIMAEALKFGLWKGSLVHNDSGDYFLPLANGDVWPITCIGSLRTWEELPNLVVQQEDFFSLTDSSTSIIAVFERPLSNEEEKGWLDRAAGIVSLQGLTRPNDYLGSVYYEQDLNVLISRVLIVVCLLCTLRLMTYLFLLRKQEFIVLRMLGANDLKIGTLVATMLLEVAGAAIILGGIVYYGVISIPITTKLLYPLTPQWIANDIGFFLVAVIMSGICMFFLNNKVDVTRASEEV